MPRCDDSAEVWQILELLFSDCKQTGLCRPASPRSSGPPCASLGALVVWTTARTTCRDPFGVMDHPSRCFAANIHHLEEDLDFVEPGD
jgi:hypothetical protein